MVNKPLFIGILLATINAFMLAGMVLFAKLLSPHYGAIEVTFLRNIFALIAIFVFLISTKNLRILTTQRPWAHLLRGLIGTIGIVIGTWALSVMPLAETTILLFTAPLFVVLLSYPILKEPVGKRRLIAVIIGFTGVIIALNPTASLSNLPLLGIIAGLLWGFFAGCVDTCLRWMGKTENSTTTVFYFVLFGSLTTGAHWPFAEIKPAIFTIDILWLIIGIGTCGLLSLLAKTQSFRLARASIIAPIMYSMIIWVMVFDYIFWNKVPTINILIGATIIMASNIFILYRESRAKS